MTRTDDVFHVLTHILCFFPVLVREWYVNSVQERERKRKAGMQACRQAGKVKGRQAKCRQKAGTRQGKGSQEKAGKRRAKDKQKARKKHVKGKRRKAYIHSHNAKQTDIQRH